MQTIFKFDPIYKERPWGDRGIGQIGNHTLPPGKKIGESWEICDRSGDENVITEGEFKGKSIRWLLDTHGSEVMGRSWKKDQRFPLLIKLLDAEERLSLQVHPPSAIAPQLKGESKTEMWYFVKAQPHAAILAGLKKGVKRNDFEKALKNNALEPLVHRIPVKQGEAIFIPSGRIHAIDAGCLILEIQENSDTTYRVYDWGRVGLDGKPRDLHIQESLQSIDFNDFEPEITKASSADEYKICSCEYFSTFSKTIKDQTIFGSKKSASILHVLEGKIEIILDQEKVSLREGETALLSAKVYQLHGPAKLIFISGF